ncbi:MAG: carbon-nitrogen hydrolase family protein [Trueperaceae bacterium]|nr:carbon-nitrogen hydrolase family protein [Trueperaceae bacterium]
MNPLNKASKPFSLAIAQMPITGDARQNGQTVRTLMQDASAQGARLLQFPEGALSGYAKNPIQSWDEVNWEHVRSELESIMVLAKQLQLWVVLGSAHPLSEPNWPHNSLYIISDEGKLVNRYDKRLCSYTETSRFYTPGTEAITFEVDGFMFGCLICVEINFPPLFIEYEKLGIDCLLLSSYPVDKVFYTKTLALAAIYNYWISLSVPMECLHLMKSALIGPDGQCAAEVKENQGVVVTNLDVSDPRYEIALNRARPWRASAFNDFKKRQPSSDPRSTNRSS